MQHQYSSNKPFIGKLQPSQVRIPTNSQSVIYSKNNENEIRKVKIYSSFKAPIIATKSTKFSSIPRFARANRFNTHTEPNYPKYIASTSSLQKQILSQKPNSSKVEFGTSLRESVAKMYTLNNCRSINQSKYAI